MRPSGAARIAKCAVLAALALALLLAATGCENSVLNQEAEWAEEVEAYYVEARAILERYTAADAEFRVILDKAQAASLGEGDPLTEEDLRTARDAVGEMTAADQDWLDLQVPVQEIYDADLAIEESMREVRTANKELLAAIETGEMAPASDSFATREAAADAVEAAIADLESYYEENERRIERGLS
jgi:hypothetical protein